VHASCRQTLARAAATALGLGLVLLAGHAGAQGTDRTTPRPMLSAPALAAAAAPDSDSLPRLACTSVVPGEPLALALGKSRLVQLQSPAIRIIGGGRSSMGAMGEPPRASPGGATPQRSPGAPQAALAGAGSDGVADTEITLLGPTEMLMVGRRPGSANVILQDREGRCVVRDITVTVDPQALEGALRQLMPRESGVRVSAADNAVVLTGHVRDAATLGELMTLADVFGGGRKIVNLLRVSAPQQVMLEVKIAEVSKSLLDRFGLDFARVINSGGRSTVLQGIIGGQSGVLGRFGPNAPGSGSFSGAAAVGVGSASAAAGASLNAVTRGASLLGIDIDNRDGIFRVLAEPNIMAISGQKASFLSGGKIFIPVAQSTQGAGTTITLEEKEFGVGLQFTPTVLDGRINLKVVSEVSELSQSGTPFTTVAGATSVLPSMTTRRVDTTIQLSDGQSFVVAGLIRNNVTEALSRIPGLGEAPVVGALFRSTEFQNDMTELMFVVTPRLVRPLAGAVPLPTDNHVVPTRADVILRGAGEGRLPPPVQAPPMPAPYPGMPAAPVTPVGAPTPVSALPEPAQTVALAAATAPLPRGENLPPLPPAGGVPIPLDEPAPPSIDWRLP